MSSSIETLITREYQHGFVTDIEADTLPPGLSEDIVRAISAGPLWPCAASKAANSTGR